MRVAFVSSHAREGGSERYLRALLNGLPRAFVGDVIALEAGPLVDALRGDGFVVDIVATAAGPASLVASAWRLRQHLRRGGCDVVHANGVKAALVSVLAMVGTRRPVVWVKHDFSWDGWLGRTIARRCAVVVGVSEAVLATIPAGHGRVVHTGLPPLTVDRDRARRVVDEVAASRPVVGLVGRFHPVRGHLDLVAAAPALLARVPSASLLFAGPDDPSQPGYRAAVLQAVDAAGLGQAVRLLGHQDDAIALIAGVDVIVLPTVADDRGMGQEGFGLVALEAMAAGTPVVAYVSGALPEVLGECGRLVPSGDRDALAQTLVDALDPVTAASMVACGQERARTAFSESRWLAEMERCYADVTR